jgi:Na+/H+-dicarboxylate symporter
MSYKKNDKNGWALFLLILSGIVLGGFLGSLAKDIKFLEWINYGQDFGMHNPLKLDLEVLELDFRIYFNITIGSIIGIVAGIFVYRKL